MYLKKCLKTKSAQAVVEYILLFSIMVLGVLLAFGSFNPDRLGISIVMNNAVESALTEIRR